MRVATSRCAVAIASAVLAFGAFRELRAEEQAEEFAPERGCTFRADPSAYLNAQARTRDAVHSRIKDLDRQRFASRETEGTSADPIPHRSFIDTFIFGKLAVSNVKPARLSSDEEFIRRVYLDIIGRIPTAQDVKDFLASADPDKRGAVIDRLLLAPEFNDKWAVWFEDLVGMTESLSTNNRRPQVEGRNNFDMWIREKMSHNMSMTEIVSATLTATGNNYYPVNGAANLMVAASTAMGPIQDTYDMMLVKSASAYLGMGHYDCLLCHSGRGHLDQVSSWGTRTTRADAHRMAAHFARTTLNPVRTALQYQSPLYNSTDVQDAATGTYQLNTTFGNRPNRTRYGTEAALTPEYRDGTRAEGTWRVAFAKKLTSDPMFAINFANRIWKEFFGLALVDPVDTLDPDRLDPANPPAAPWGMQTAHPELLQELAKHFVKTDTNLRELIKLITSSSAYQLSSYYDGEWKAEYVPLYARHYPRRMWAEEVHDAIVQATGVMPQYSYLLINNQTVAQGTPTNSLLKSEPTSWAMKMPDINEPRFLNGTQNGSAVTFLNSFSRGNRDTAQRSQAGSILQQLNLMNDNSVVLQKVRMANSPTLKELANIADNGALVAELWLTFLSRRPDSREKAKAVAHLSKVARNTAIEDLAWVAINKVDFLFSY